jgi:hypothetical protein
MKRTNPHGGPSRRRESDRYLRGMQATEKALVVGPGGMRTRPAPSLASVRTRATPRKSGLSRPKGGMGRKRHPRRVGWLGWLLFAAVLLGHLLGHVAEAFLTPVADYVAPHYLRQWLPEPAPAESVAAPRGPPLERCHPLTCEEP